MSILRSFTAALLGLGVFAGSALADGHLDAAVKARKAHMQLYAFNLGQLGGMAKGEIDYDAAAAGAAAANLADLAAMNQARYWPEGSDNFAMGEETRTLPALWDNIDDVRKISGDLEEATTALASAAGQDLDSLRAALGDVGKACGACHEDYRQSND